jgi:hypothetical protein
MIWKTKKREVRRAGSASLLFLSANAVLVAADGGAGSSVSPWCAIVRNKPNRQGPSAGDAGRAVQTNPIRRADHAKQTQFPAAGISPHSTTLLFHHANPVVIVPNKPNFARRPRPRWRDVRNKPNWQGPSAGGAGRAVQTNPIWRVGRAKRTQFLPLCRSGDRRSREAHRAKQSQFHRSVRAVEGERCETNPICRGDRAKRSQFPGADWVQSCAGTSCTNKPNSSHAG